MRSALFVPALTVALVISGSLPATRSSPFDSYFTNATMRVDYFHSGGLGQEILALDQVVSDGPWAGSRSRLVDDLNLGKYLFDVVDRETNRTIYSRGFASVYGEWESTAIACRCIAPSASRSGFRGPRRRCKSCSRSATRTTAFASCGPPSSIPIRAS